jgi:hypothetical protein
MQSACLKRANKGHSQIKWGGIRSRRYHRGMRGKLQEKLLKQLEDAVDELQKRRVEYVEYGDPEKLTPKKEKATGGLERCELRDSRSPSSYLKHVEGLYWTMQALECQFT